MYKKLYELLKKVFECQDIKEIEYSELHFEFGLSPEHILKVIKWLFIEQDIAYWNYSGRNMTWGLVPDKREGQTFTSLPPTNLSFPKTSGYDGDNLRVTNIVGIQNGDFLKECPKCGRAKCSEQFGLRTTVNRDQSECTDCRGEY